MKQELDQFLALWWKGFAKGMSHDLKVDQLRMAASCLWAVGHPECTDEERDDLITQWLETANPM